MELVHQGKVRDVYQDANGDLILVASDRVSVYDVVLPTPIPDKGKILTQLSLWWFRQLADVVPNHVISADDVPAEWAGRAVRCRCLKMLPVEFIARGYLAGLGLAEYQKNGTVSGVSLPAGLAEGSQLPEPVFTPTTKATVGHDEFITFDDVVAEIGAEVADRLRSLTLEIYSRGAALAAERGVIIADTKLEFGLNEAGEPVLADELLTSDSSRFWAAEDWHPGMPQRYLDKQFVRDWSSTIADWDRTPPGPPIPDDVVEATRTRYAEVYECITGTPWPAVKGRRSDGRGAQVMSEFQEFYDPYNLVEEVAALLRERGLRPTMGNPEMMGQAVGGAGMLLRALGIRPGQDAVTALSRSVSQEPWEDHDR